jgi:hypothetical protein
MPIDGKYNVELQTTMGNHPIGLTLETKGNTLTGKMDGHFGEHTFSGTLHGNELAWTLNLQSPFGAMSLAVTATVKDDTIEGEVKLGSFRPSLFKGKRV